MKKAFTLIELLVVIAIIAILAAILFPVFAQAKLAAKKAAGLAQQKQIGTALQMYASDYDDGIPTWNQCLATYPTTLRPAACPDGLFAAKYYWDVMLSPYVKNGRPELSQWSGLWRSPGAEYQETQGRSIGMNQLAMWNPTVDNACAPNSTSAFSGCYYWLNLGQVSAVADTIYIGDGGKGGRLDPIYYLNSYAENWMPAYATYGQNNWAAPWRYGREGANYTYMDSHAKYFKGDALYVNPGHSHNSLVWPANITAQTYCNAAKYQAPDDQMKTFLRGFALTRGVTCAE